MEGLLEHRFWKSFLFIIKFYNSKPYEILDQKDTKLWYEGINYLYRVWQREQNEEELDILKMWKIYIDESY